MLYKLDYAAQVPLYRTHRPTDSILNFGNDCNPYDDKPRIQLNNRSGTHDFLRNMRFLFQIKKNIATDSGCTFSKERFLANVV